jgi:hypothetical protein
MLPLVRHCAQAPPGAASAAASISVQGNALRNRVRSAGTTTGIVMNPRSTRWILHRELQRSVRNGVSNGSARMRWKPAEGFLFFSA